MKHNFGTSSMEPGIDGLDTTMNNSTTSVILPTTVEEALQALANQPGAQVLAGGTDFMVGMNYGHRQPSEVVSLRAVDELRGWHRDGKSLVLGASLTYSEMLEPELANLAPALAQAARTVGSPQIRNTGTIGGNIATASPAGDLLPVLVALDALIIVDSINGRRSVPISELIIGVKQTVLAANELIVSVTIPLAAGPQEFLKIGKRKAMVIAVANLVLVADLQARRVACALGAVGPTILRCLEAEAMLVDQIDWDNAYIENSQVYETFSDLCAKASLPIDDHRSTAAYRRHAISVLAQRALKRAFPPKRSIK